MINNVILLSPPELEDFFFLSIHLSMLYTIYRIYYTIIYYWSLHSAATAFGVNVILKPFIPLDIFLGELRSNLVAAIYSYNPLFKTSSHRVSVSTLVSVDFLETGVRSGYWGGRLMQRSLLLFVGFRWNLANVSVALFKAMRIICGDGERNGGSSSSYRELPQIHGIVGQFATAVFITDVWFRVPLCNAISASNHVTLRGHLIYWDFRRCLCLALHNCLNFKNHVADINVIIS